MGVDLILTGHDEEDHETDFCTNGGYSLFCNWLDSLPKDRFPAASKLSEDGFFEGTDVLAEQLEEAFAEMPPKDEDVRHTADRFLDLIGTGYPDETVVIE